ncbi:hypothetical protein [Streptomyces sp. NPDC059861]|uniref:hypothetical protein n=1 Tax=Streptomyces sp. NPDC059861 TaxID=3346974 RepID=UPI0036480D7E
MQQTLTILETAAPVGLDGKRRDFHAFTDMSGAGMQFFRTHLAELTVGSHLAQAGVPFRFNTADAPDLHTSACSAHLARCRARSS